VDLAVRADRPGSVLDAGGRDVFHITRA
jgi:hypothetical protein